MMNKKNKSTIVEIKERGLTDEMNEAVVMRSTIVEIKERGLTYYIPKSDIVSTIVEIKERGLTGKEQINSRVNLQ